MEQENPFRRTFENRKLRLNLQSVPHCELDSSFWQILKKLGFYPLLLTLFLQYIIYVLMLRLSKCFKASQRNLNPLTTSAESYFDLREIFTSDSLYFLKNKMFLNEFFYTSGFKDITFFLIFNGVNLFFITFF